MRIVIDTNVVISALFFGGKPKEVVLKVFEKTIEAYASPSIIGEYRLVFKRLISKTGKKISDRSLAMFIPTLHIVPDSAVLKSF